MTDHETRHILIESLAFENASLECKNILGPLKGRLAPIEEQVFYTMNIETLEYSTEAWARETLSNGISEEAPKCQMF